MKIFSFDDLNVGFTLNEKNSFVSVLIKRMSCGKPPLLNPNRWMKLP
jgi:hypothetical protein